MKECLKCNKSKPPLQLFYFDYSIIKTDYRGANEYHNKLVCGACYIQLSSKYNLFGV